MPFPQELPVQTYAKGTMPVGTPVKVFAPYSAPAFTTPAALIGQVIAPVTLQSTVAMDQVNVPFTFGHAFKRGDLGPDCSLVGAIQGSLDLPLQVNVKATHDDGSVRHAIISGVLPSLPAGASVVMGLKRSAAVASLNAPLPAALPNVTLVIGGTAFVAIPKASDFAYVWLAGSLLTDYVANVPFVDASGQAHPTLAAQFSVRAYASGNVRVDVAIEHCKAYASTTDITYDAEVFVNGASAHKVAALIHTPTARWHKQFWHQAPQLHIKHDTAYLIASRAVPNYDQTVKMDEATLSSYATSLASGSFGPMKFGRFNPAMGSTGGRPELGLMPDSYAAALLSMDKRAKDMMLASADAAGSWPAHRRDDGTGPGNGLPLSVINYPYASILGISTDCSNPMTGRNEHLPDLTTASAGQPDTSHQAAFAYLPYLLTGDYYYLEELHFWASFNNYVNNCGYRKYEKALVFADQVRGQGWSLRTLAECAAITPDDHPSKQSFIFWYESNMAWFNTTYIDAPDPKYSNQLGFIANGYAIGYSSNGRANVGMAPWMDDHFMSSLGHAGELLLYASVKKFMTWKTKFQLGRLIASGACPPYAANYTLNVRQQEASPFYETLADCFKDSLSGVAGAYDATNNTPERVAMFDNAGYTFAVPDGYPSDPAGYMANYQPALAMAIDSDVGEGLKAWKVFMARMPKPNYGASPQFAVVPRLLTEVVSAPAPAPAPEPAPVPAPTPVPDPVPAPTQVAGTIKGPTNTKLVKLTGLSMTVFNPSTLASVKRFTALTASSKGVLTVKDPALVPGSVYAAVVADASGKVLVVMYPLTAA